MLPVYAREADVHPSFLQGGGFGASPHDAHHQACCVAAGVSAPCSSGSEATTVRPGGIRVQEAPTCLRKDALMGATRQTPPQRWSLGDLSRAEMHQTKLMQHLSSTCELHHQEQPGAAEQSAWVASSLYVGCQVEGNPSGNTAKMGRVPSLPDLAHRASCDSSACTHCHRRSLSVIPCEVMQRKRSFGDRSLLSQHALERRRYAAASESSLSSMMAQSRSEGNLSGMDGSSTASCTVPYQDASDDMDIDEQDDYKRRRSISQLGWMNRCQRSQASQSWGRATEDEVRGTNTPAKASFSKVCELHAGEASSAVPVGQLVGKSTKHVIQDLAVKDNGIHMAGATRAKQVCVYNVFDAIQQDCNDSLAPVVCHKMPARVCCMSWSPAKENVLSMGDQDGVLWQMDVSSGHVIHEIDEHSGDRIWSVTHSKHHPAIVAAASGKACVSLWDTMSGTQAGKICLQNRKMPVCSVEFSPFAEHLIAMASADHGVYLYDLRNPSAPCHTLTGHKRPVSYVRFMSQDRLVSSSIDGMVRLWDGLGGAAQQPRVEKTFQDHVNQKNFVGLSVHSNGLIACGSEDGAAYAYFPSWKEKVAVTNPVGPDRGFVTSVAWINTDNLGIPLQDCPPMLAVGNTLGHLELLALVRQEGHQDLPAVMAH